jgi:hypothetical protein
MSAAGPAWEQYVEEESAWLAARGIARAVRVKPPINRLGLITEWLKREMGVEIPKRFLQRAKGLFIAVASGEPSVDFEGSVRGYKVAFDAKSSEAEPSWPLGDIRDDQITYLADCARAGEMAFLYVQRRGAKGRPRYVLPVDREGRVAGQCHKRDRLGELWAAARKESVRWVEVEMWRVGQDEMWADAVMRLRPVWPGIKQETR